MSPSPICPRCGADVSEPDLAHPEWRCGRCGPVAPLHITDEVSADLVEAVCLRIMTSDGPVVPLWCPWPLAPGWSVTGLAWAGDDQTGPQATALALSGPAPLGGGPADVVFVAERPGVGLGAALAGLGGLDPGPPAVGGGAGAKVRADGHPTPLWAMPVSADRSGYVGEARAVWLYAVGWPAEAGFVLADDVVLVDLADGVPRRLTFGVPSRRLSPQAPSL